jgi:hypothetical protein
LRFNPGEAGRSEAVVLEGGRDGHRGRAQLRKHPETR